MTYAGWSSRAFRGEKGGVRGGFGREAGPRGPADPATPPGTAPGRDGKRLSLAERRVRRRPTHLLALDTAAAGHDEAALAAQLAHLLGSRPSNPPKIAEAQPHRRALGRNHGNVGVRLGRL